jgi:hypothetical protein
MSTLKLAALAAVASAVLFPAAAFAHGVSGPAFYVDGQLYRTVGTPSDFSSTGAPTSSFDTIYAFPAGTQRNVATAAPGDPGFNGGRWQVQVLTFTDYQAAVTMFDANHSGDLDSDEEVIAAIQAGYATVSPGPSFECPVIPLSQGGA